MAHILSGQRGRYRLIHQAALKLFAYRIKLDAP